MHPAAAAATTTAFPALKNASFFVVLATFFSTSHLGGVMGTLVSIWAFLTGLSILVSFFFIALLTYATIRRNQTKHEEHPRYATLEPKEAENQLKGSRWGHIADLIESSQESDWRQAIIEADIMLNDVLGQHGYQGDSVGEKLKQGDPTRFRTLRDAWDAHMVRNQIAHEGSSFQITGAMAYRTIAKYQNVFEEFHAI